VGEDAVDEVRGGVDHATSPAGRTEAAALAREGDELVAQAARAVHAREAVGEQAAFEVTP